MPYLQQQADGSFLLALHVQPRARKNEITGIHDNALKLRLTTPPVDGRANKAVIAFIADQLGLAKSAVTIQSGARSRAKRVLIRNCDETTIRTMIQTWTAEPSA